MNRRDFFGASAALTLGAAVAPTSSAFATQTTEETDKRAEAKLRICSQLGPAPGNSLEEKLEKAKKYGCDAIEYGGECIGKGAELRKKAEDAGLEVSVICWGSHGGDLCSEDVSPTKRFANFSWNSCLTLRSLRAIAIRTLFSSRFAEWKRTSFVK